MLLDYFTSNFMTLMILFSLATVMLVNRDVKIPATRLFATSMILLVIVTVVDYIAFYAKNSSDCTTIWKAAKGFPTSPHS